MKSDQCLVISWTLLPSKKCNGLGVPHISHGLNLHAVRCFLANQYFTTRLTTLGTGGNLCWPASNPLSMHPNASGNISSKLPTSLICFSALAHRGLSSFSGIFFNARIVSISSLRCWYSGSANDSIIDRKLSCECSAGVVKVQYSSSRFNPLWKAAC